MPPTTLPELAPIRPDEDFDHARLAQYLSANLPAGEGGGADPAGIEVLQFPGGHSNLTYLARLGGREFVVRRPPLGQLPANAHDMGREFRILSRLYAAFPPAPRAYLYCENPSIIGAPFLVMERRTGTVIRNAWPPELPDDPELRGRVSRSMIDTLAALHLVDYAAVGLGDFGKPEGFLARQVKGWAERWERAKTREVRAIDQVVAWLNEKMPASTHASIIHNDYKLDNVMLSAADPGVIGGVFDWEMSALGDPLVDLGITITYWAHLQLPGKDGRRLVPTATPGFLTREQLLERYAEKTGFDVGPIRYYEVFALFKNAIVLEQIYVRYVRGQTKDQRFAALGPIVEPIILMADKMARESGL